MTSIDEALRAAQDCRDRTGRPVKGRLSSLHVNATVNGWQVLVAWWFVERFTVVQGADLADCVRQALAKGPNYAPLPRDQKMDFLPPPQWTNGEITYDPKDVIEDDELLV